MQYDLFDSLISTMIEVAPQAELPKVLSRHPHGIQLGAYFVPYQLLRSKRRSIGFLITAQGLRITAPRWISQAEINAAILHQQRWILKKLHEQQNRPAPPVVPPTVWRTGATLPFLGRITTLAVQYSEETYFDNVTGILTLNLPSDAAPAECKQHLQIWLMQQARTQFSQRLPHFAQQLDVQYHSFALSNAKTQWGSCNAQGKIRLNWRLIHCAEHLIDYVIAHELAHLREMNHSPRFWATVARVFPDYKAAREELKQLGLKGLPLL